jgi:hypothetical protein
MIRNGHYMYSRLPGHPVQELVLLLMPSGGPFLYNLLSALFGTLAVLFFARIMKLYSFRFPVIGGLVLAFIPVFYISCTYTIDYCWALAFIMMSYYFLVKQRFALAGVLLGIAAGCRLTSAVMFVPFVIMLFGMQRSIRWKAIIVFCIAALLAGVIVYLPAINQYGAGILSTYPLPYPPLAKAIYKGTFGVWGIAGIAALLITFIIIILKARKKQASLFNENPGRLHIIAWIVAIILNAAIFIRLPEKSAFFIPALPFIILFIAYWIRSKTAFIVFSSLIIISPFIAGINLTDNFRGAAYSSLAKKFTVSGQEVFIDPVNGPVMNDFYKRKNKEQFTLKAIERMQAMKEPALVLTGWWHNEILVRIKHSGRRINTALMSHASEKQLQWFRSRGMQIYFLPEIDRINDSRYGGSFTANYAEAFPQ